MTPEQAAKRQAEIAEKFNLGWWYGTDCEKCCGVYPKFKTTNTPEAFCYYECEVCGKRTEIYSMPWLARNAWNEHKYKKGLHQLSLF